MVIKKSIIKGICRFARVFGLLMVGFILLFFVGESIGGESQNLEKLTTQEILLFIGMIAMVVGLIVGWFRPGIGGLCTLDGFILFLVVELIYPPHNFDVWILMAFPIIGLLNIFCWWQSRKTVLD